MTLSNLEKQDLRHACLRAIAVRPRVFFGAGQVSAFARRLLPFQYDVADVADALELLVGLKHAEKTDDPMGSESLYKVTAEGVLAHERAENT